MVTLNEKTTIRAGAAIAAAVVLFWIAFYLGQIDKGTKQDEVARLAFEKELERMESAFDNAVDSLRAEIRTSVDGLRAEMRSSIGPMMTREDARAFLESAMRQAALELQIPLLQRIGDLEGRVKSLEDNGHRKGGSD